MTKPKNLFASILLFILLDLSILGINYWIAYQISKDAIAINLSGRQRMLSQRITKTLLALPHVKSPEDRTLTIQEFRDSAKMFDQTLSAFQNGGVAIGGDGKAVTLSRIKNAQAAEYISEAQKIWTPICNRLKPYLTSKINIPEALLLQTQHEMLNQNLQLLDMMNRLTSAMEQSSRDQANSLRIIQTIVFALALINFIIIVRKFHLLAHHAQQASLHFSKLALHDALTGLFNRRQIEQKLDHELMNTNSERHHKLTLMMLDLDGFKSINDIYGHEAGDMVLQTVATRLSQHANKNDTVARLGGDEFVLITSQLESESAAVNSVAELIQAINKPISMNGVNVNVGASVGIVFQPELNRSRSDILRMADNAMYKAKISGKNRYSFANGD
jgi:diguanylate cyclase (GGDEF)-like protein